MVQLCVKGQNPIKKPTWKDTCRQGSPSSPFIPRHPNITVYVLLRCLTWRSVFHKHTMSPLWWQILFHDGSKAVPITTLSLHKGLSQKAWTIFPFRAKPWAGRAAPKLSVKGLRRFMASAHQGCLPFLFLNHLPQSQDLIEPSGFRLPVEKLQSLFYRVSFQTSIQIGGPGLRISLAVQGHTFDPWWKHLHYC